MNGVMIDYQLKDETAPNTFDNREWFFMDLRTSKSERGFDTKEAAFKAARRSRREHFQSNSHAA